MADLRTLAQENPEAFRKLAAKLFKEGKLVIPHAHQQPIFDSTARFRTVCCGRRFGKTVIAAKTAIKQTREPNKMVWWVAPTYKVVKRGYREVLRQLPRELLDHEPAQETAFDAGRSVVLRFKNGSRMEFYSAERPEGMLGEGVDFVVLDEAARIGKSVWEQTIRPTLMDHQGGAMLISTPRGRNWFYYLWLRGQDPAHIEYESWQMPTSANPFIAPEEVEEMRESMPLVVFQQEVLAEFIASAGSVFRFSPEIIVDRVKPAGHVVVGVDLAKTVDFTVFEAARAEDGMPCGYDRFNEVSWPQQRNRLKSFCTRLMRQGASGVTLVMDSTGVGDPITEDMEMAGYDVVPINFKKYKAQMVVQLAKDLEDGFVRLGPERIEELENYTYKVTDHGNFTYSAPEGQHDDVVSAKMLCHWGIVQEGAPNITSISAGDSMSNPSDPDDLSAGNDGYNPAADDWSDLVDPDEASDTGVAVIEHVQADSPAAIMARPEAWGR